MSTQSKNIYLWYPIILRYPYQGTLHQLYHPIPPTPPITLLQSQLVQAIDRKNYERTNQIIEELNEEGLGVNFGDIINRTPLHWAVLSQDLQIVKLLIASGAAVNAVDQYGLTPLHYAVKNNAWQIVQYLIGRTPES